MEKNWKADLDSCIQNSEPSQTEKSAVWQIAIGLQDVDGLKPSAYLLETAREHIEGTIDMSEARARVQIYHEEQKERQKIEDGTREADLVSVRIAELLTENTFQFSPTALFNTHGRLFAGLLPHAGEVRPYNITKREWILNGKTVYYASYDSIQGALDYVFEREKDYAYGNVPTPDAVKHIAAFTSEIWQIHPFCEGNTRTTAVFMLQYLKTFNFQINPEVFADHSWYFRNALVRANYNDLPHGIYATTEYLEHFFENLMMGAKHELKNRYLHIDYPITHG